MTFKEHQSKCEFHKKGRPFQGNVSCYCAENIRNPKTCNVENCPYYEAGT